MELGYHFLCLEITLDVYVQVILDFAKRFGRNPVELGVSVWTSSSPFSLFPSSHT